jgi:hypothetical protein
MTGTDEEGRRKAVCLSFSPATFSDRAERFRVLGLVPQRATHKIEEGTSKACSRLVAKL